MNFYERRRQRLASREVFRRRLIRSGSVGSIMVIISLAVGIAGYYYFESLDFLDSFVNAAMILSGMGPLHDPTTVAGKVFAGIFALYSGFAVLVIAAIAFAPVVHRVLHHFHIEAEQDALDRTGERPRSPAKPGGP
jgi:hypothetical protein